MTLRHRKTLRQPLFVGSYLTGPCPTSREICDTPKKTSQALQGHGDHRKPTLGATSTVRGKIDEKRRHVQLQHATVGFQRSSPVEPESQSENDSPSRKSTLAATVRGVISHRPMLDFSRVCDTSKKTSQAFQGHEDHQKLTLGATSTSLLCSLQVDPQARNFKKENTFSYNVDLSDFKDLPSRAGPCSTFREICDTPKKTSQAFQGHEDHRKPRLRATSTSILSSLQVDPQVRNFKKEDTFSYNVELSDFQDLPWSGRNLSRKMTLRHGKTLRQPLFARSYLIGQSSTSCKICDTSKKTSQAF
uniref:Uncharacterized protein n=1 Tax=Fagus sylvatica TaxID=28930 RepID=A0A2N9I3C7_FAGSY